MDAEPPRKKKRLNYACDRCRSHRVRCDDRQPSCTRCAKAGAVCTTKDPRNPDRSVVRHESARPQSEHTFEQLPPSSGILETTPSRTSPADEGQSRSLGHVYSTSRDEHSISIDRAELPNTVSPAKEARLPALPRFVHGNSLFILTQWLDLALARLNHGQRFSHLCRDVHAARFSSYHDFTFASHAEIQLAYRDPGLLEEYLRTVHTAFPLRPVSFWHALAAPEADADPADTFKYLLQALLVAVSRPVRYGHDEVALRCLHYAFTRLHLLLSHRSLDSITAMILMVIAFRARNDGETAVHLLSTAISLAQTMGIHRKSDRIYTPRSDSESVEFRSNCWWTIYVLDQVLALELERRPIVDERDCDLSPPRHSNYQVAPNVSNTIFTELVKLAKVQSIVNAELHKGRQAEESESINVQDVIAKKIKTAGELDMKLTDWEASLPISLRPSELSYSSPGILPAAAFLAMQYYQTLFLVSRNALIVNEKQVQHLIDTKLSKENPALRIRNGKALCSNLVRSIISLLGLIRDNNAQSVFDTVYSPLVAAIGLAISIIRSPSASNARMDLALYKIAVSSIHDREQSFASSHHNGPMKLSTLLGKLEPDLATRIERAADHDTTSLPADAFEATTRANEESTTTHRHGQLSGQHHADLGDASLDTGIEAFDASSLWDQDFSGILDGNLDFGDDGWATLAEALDLPSVRFDNSPVQTI